MASFQEFKDRSSPRAGFPGWRGSRAERSALYRQGSGGPHPAAICRAASETRAEIRIARPSSGRSPAGIWLENRTTLHDGCESRKEQTVKCCANRLLPLPARASPLQGAEAPGVRWGKLAGVPGSPGRGPGASELELLCLPRGALWHAHGGQRIRVQSERSSD